MPLMLTLWEITMIEDYAEEGHAWRRSMEYRFPYDNAEILAIGPISGDRILVAAEDGFDLRFGESHPFDPYPLLTIPRGLPPETARLLIAAWDTGRKRGFGDGRADMLRAMKRHAMGLS